MCQLLFHPATTISCRRRKSSTRGRESSKYEFRPASYCIWARDAGLGILGMGGFGYLPGTFQVFSDLDFWTERASHLQCPIRSQTFYNARNSKSYSQENFSH